MIIDYYKTLMSFSGCPKAFYMQNYDIINFIENQLTFNFKECETFVQDFVVKVYIQDRSIQENAERLEYMENLRSK
jgi:hypothetical protein